MATKFPEQVILDPDEFERINRVRVGLALHKFPHEVDEMPEADYEDVIEVLRADEMLSRSRS